MKTIVSVNWLLENLSHKDIILLDTSLNIDVNTYQTIPTSRYFDIKHTFSDKSSRFPNALPTEENFEIECQKLGINTTSKIVVFDEKGIYSSPRVWWMFKGMGHEDVFVLNGGLPEWVKHGFKTEVIKSQNGKGDFKAKFSPDYVKTFEDVAKNITEESFLLVDARSKGRFDGTAPEPRKTLQSGHIKNSINIPFTSVLTHGKFKSKDELQDIFQDLTSDKEMVFSCGSGITACILSLASELSGKTSRTIFDGSWSEWAERNGLFTALD